MRPTRIVPLMTESRWEIRDITISSMNPIPLGLVTTRGMIVLIAIYKVIAIITGLRLSWSNITFLLIGDFNFAHINLHPKLGMLHTMFFTEVSTDRFEWTWFSRHCRRTTYLFRISLFIHNIRGFIDDYLSFLNPFSFSCSWYFFFIIHVAFASWIHFSSGSLNRYILTASARQRSHMVSRMTSILV